MRRWTGLTATRFTRWMRSWWTRRLHGPAQRHARNLRTRNVGEDTITRFRPDFFPFVEPGVDFAISSPKFEGGRWLELGGAGLIHPSILERYGIDTERYSGFAFGLGIDRIPLLAYGIDDLRYFLDNDLRFLAQFPG